MALTDVQLRAQLAELQRAADAGVGDPGPATALRVEEILALIRALPQENLHMSADRLTEAFDHLFQFVQYARPDDTRWPSLVRRECARILVRLRTDPDGNVI
jgi:hypothetical protein